jgi:hypothetical protein
MFTLQESGLRQTVALFEGIPDEVRRRLLPTIEDLAQAVKAGAVARVPVKTGQLRNSIQYRILNKQGEVKAIVSPKRGRRVARAESGFYGIIIEGGAKPHKIRPKNRKRMAFTLPGVGVVFARGVSHPGIAADPFMRPAYEAQRERIRGELTKAVEGGSP